MRFEKKHEKSLAGDGSSSPHALSAVRAEESPAKHLSAVTDVVVKFDRDEEVPERWDGMS